MNTGAPSDITQRLESISDEDLTAHGPVFVDTTGRRRKRVRFVAAAVSAACVLYTGLLAFSLFTGGSVGLDTLFPDGGSSAAKPAATANPSASRAG